MKLSIRRAGRLVATPTLLVGALGLSPSAALAQGVASAYGALPIVEDVTINASGAFLAYVQNAGAGSALVFRSIDDPAAAPIAVGIGDLKARDLVPVGEEYVLFNGSTSENVAFSSGLEMVERFRWIAVSRETAKARQLMEGGKVIASLADDASSALISSGGTLHKVSFKSGNPKTVALGKEETVDWVVDKAGEPVLRVDWSDALDERSVWIRDGARYRKGASMPEGRADRARFTLWGMLSETTAAATGYINGRNVAYEMDVETGAVVRTLFAHPTHDVDAVVYDHDAANAIGVRYTDDLPRYRYFDAALDATQASLTKALGGAAAAIVSMSDDRNRMIVRATYTDHPPQHFLYDKAAKRLDMIASAYPALDGKSIASKEKYDFTASDGLTIPGYLTVPRGASRQKMPLVVLPHGGPSARDDQGFDWWAFFYASNGYAVYQPNFRGSSGYGASFEAAGYSQWGRKMQDDVSNGVRKLIADGFVDQDRICIAGASYGGYAALAGAAFTPELYACAVSVNGVSQLPSLIGRDSRRSEIAAAWYSLYVGDRFDDKALLAASPAESAATITAPVLLMHGDRDAVVPQGQSILMVDALKAAGKPHEYIELKDEDHWLSRPATRTQMLEESLRFIRAAIGPGETPAQ